MALRHHIGIEITRAEFRLVEIRMNDGFVVVLRCGVYPTTHAFGSALLHQVPFDHALAKSFVHDASIMFHERALFASHMSIVVPDHAAVLTVLPLEEQFSDADLQEHLQWECATLSGLPEGTRFRVRTREAGKSGDTRLRLLAGMPQATIEFLTSAFSHLTFAVHAIEVEHLLFESMLPAPADGAAPARAVLGMHEHVCTSSILSDSHPAGLRSVAVDTSETRIRTALHSLRAVLQSTDATIDEAFVFGPHGDEQARAELASVTGIPVRAFNPMRAVTFLSGAEAAHAGSFPPHTFNAALLAAVKGAS